jgi:hypothetical protein
MSLVPKLSFIVLSYNYADLIGPAIRSQPEKPKSSIAEGGDYQDRGRRSFAGAAQRRLPYKVRTETVQGMEAVQRKAVVAER